MVGLYDALTMSLVYFALLLGSLIFFHEFGHFIVARMCGVRVLEFSIGFGPQVGAFVRNGTIYRIGALPLGGYVKMLGADPLEEVPEEHEEGSFASKALWQRTLIVLAGPVFNLILPLFVFFFLFLGQKEVNPAVLGTLQPEGVAARAGLLPGDVIKSVDGNSVEGWWELQDLVGNSGGEVISVVVERDGEDMPAVDLRPKLVTEVIAPELGLEREVGRIQIEIAYRQPIVMVAAGSAAEASGLKDWDHIVAIDGAPAGRWEYVVRDLARSDKPVALTVLREETLSGVAEGLATFGLSTYSAPVEVTLQPKSGDGSLGLDSAEFYIYDVTPGSPEASAGIARGDKILTLNGKQLSSWGLLIHEVKSAPDSVHTVELERAGEKRSVKLSFERHEHKGEFNTDITSTIFGIVNRSAYGAPDLVPNTKRVSFAAYEMWSQTKRSFLVTAKSLAGLFTGDVGFKQMGGPIFIYEVASKTEEAGWVYFFNLMAWLSISLGLINLVPIPLLDGGHLMFFAIEAIKRRPASLRTRQIASYIGFSMIIVLMLLVFKNDIGRNWDRLVSIFL
ncbi:MAG: regulator of sigma E protease [Myxococcota bacterium]|jgi:regulator of sigma E protease